MSRRALLLPGVFIPAAERYQQMRAVDRWVVRAALSHLAARGDAMRYGINVSAQSLCDAGFLDFVLGQLDAAGVPPGQICFEITETAAITDLKHALRFMGALKERGCRFALDDFGSGFASFGYLKTLPVDYLKIDGHFVKDIPVDPFDDAVVQAIQGIAETLGLRTIAESVESEAILERRQGHRDRLRPGLYARRTEAARAPRREIGVCRLIFIPPKHSPQRINGRQ